jgi:hypothetical protein
MVLRISSLMVFLFSVATAGGFGFALPEEGVLELASSGSRTEPTEPAPPTGLAVVADGVGDGRRTLSPGVVIRPSGPGVRAGCGVAGGVVLGLDGEAVVCSVLGELSI